MNISPATAMGLNAPAQGVPPALARLGFTGDEIQRLTGIQDEKDFKKATQLGSMLRNVVPREKFEAAFQEQQRQKEELKAKGLPVDTVPLIGQIVVSREPQEKRAEMQANIDLGLAGQREIRDLWSQRNPGQ